MKNNGLWTRKIIHIDMDAFFAAIEQQDFPEYRGKPLIVGGDPRGRGVVSTASYEARVFGIRSAMSAAEALKKCPKAIFVKPRFSRYQEISETIMHILQTHTKLVEPVSLDEAYLDVTHHRFGISDPVMIAKLIKQSIYAVTHLTASAGVAPNCFIAKIASDFNKPDGLTVVPPNQVQDFLKDLSVRKIPGVGPVTEKELHRLNLKTCADLEKAGPEILGRYFGKWGLELYHRSLGVDERAVDPNWERKQISTEETFTKDTRDLQFLQSQLKKYAEEVFQSVLEENKVGRTIVLKVKYHDFEQVTRSHTLAREPTQADEVFRVARRLLLEKTLAGKKPIRLIGLGISSLKSKNDSKNKNQQVPLQPDLFPLESLS